jgi:mannitol operon transcriptional antiterminator
MSTTLNSRSRSILGRLIESTQPMPVSSIAGALKVTARMVRYQLIDIEGWLLTRGARLERRPGKGIWVEYQRTTRYALMQELESPGDYENKLSENERLRLMRLSFLAEARAQTSQKLGDYLGVSKTTVAKDLKSVREWFFERGLFLKGTPGVGLNLVGDEMSWRKAISDAIMEGGNEHDFVRTLQTSVHSDSDSGTFTGTLFQSLADVNLFFVSELIGSAEGMLGLTFTDMARVSLLIHLAVMVKRLRVGREIRLSSSQSEYLQSKREFRYAKRLGAIMNEKFKVSPSDNELAYLTLHLLSARTRDEAGVERFEEDPELPGFDPRDAARKIALKAEEILGKHIVDEQLVKGLATHLTPVFYRLRFSLPVRNPLLNDIRAKYPKLFEASKQAADQFLLTAGMTLPDEEVAYVAMHIGAALERNREQQGRPRVLVVCASGLSSAAMLASRLRSEFPELEVMKTMSAHDLTGHESADLIISTVAVDAGNVPSVVVGPLLNEEDADRIRTAIYQNRIMRRDRMGRGRGSLLSSLRRLGRSDMAQLSDLLLSPGCVNLDAKATDWREAIHLAGAMLVRTGACSPEYESAMISSVEEYGPYIVVAPGIALPHAAPGKGVLRLGASFARFSTPVVFGHPHNDPVSFVIALATPDKQQVKSLMEDLTLVLLLPTTRDALRDARTAEEVVRALRPTTTPDIQ